ncbi:MAG: alcohol dehydrogenase catalytic domain-containing protein, partial [Myxococcales bacterium]|nr:alcohol dehydrogenase catalytic domain-containing protein [Myxococcales bacterium]
MKALVYDGAVHLADRPVPHPGADQALVRVTYSGICNTDLELSRGYMGFQGILGHEFVGVVERSPDPAWTGKRVVGDINYGCGRCAWCARGDAHHCPNRTVLGILNQEGAHAEYLVCPVRNLLEVPDAVADAQAVFTEPVAAAAEILEQVSMGPGEPVAVLGDGKLGLLIAQVLATTGCDLLAIGKHPEKLRTLADRGIKTALVGDVADYQAAVVVEATGSPSGFEAAMRLVRPRGTLVLKSTYEGGFHWNPAPLVINEITLVGSRCGPF